MKCSSGKPGKILMSGDAVGGVWTYSLELARALEPFGIQIVLAVMGPAPAGPLYADAAKIPNLTVLHRDYKLEWMDACWDDVKKAGDWLLDLEARIRADIIHLNGFVHAALPFRSPRLVVGHSCVLSWWQAVKGEAVPSRWSKYRAAVSRGLRSAGMVIAPSQTMLYSLEKHYGPLPRVKVVPNARDFRFFRIGTKEKFVLTAGRIWDEAKNIAALGKIGAELSVPVYAAGSRNGTHSKISWKKKETNGIRWLGQLSFSQLCGWYSRAAVFALPAKYEPFGLAPLEAALSGCSLVLGDIPSLREVWKEAALFVPPDDREALKNSVHLLLKDEAERERMACLAHARALSFSPGRMAEEYLEAYADLSWQQIAEKQEAVACMS